MARHHLQSNTTPISPKILFKDFSQVLLDYTGTKKANKIFNEIEAKHSLEYVDALLEKLNIAFEINAEDESKILQNGAFVLIANHPFGLIDGNFAEWSICFNCQSSFWFNRWVITTENFEKSKTRF